MAVRYMISPSKIGVPKLVANAQKRVHSNERYVHIKSTYRPYPLKDLRGCSMNRADKYARCNRACRGHRRARQHPGFSLTRKSVHRAIERANYVHLKSTYRLYPLKDLRGCSMNRADKYARGTRAGADTAVRGRTRAGANTAVRGSTPPR